MNPNPYQDIFWSVGDWDHFLRVLLRLVVAAALGAVIGLQRELEGKEAGARTHMLVSLGTALPVIFCLEMQMPLNDLSRVVQGLVTGIGFLGAGSILKLSEEHRIRGLTTAASIWVTAMVGIAVGAGALWPALLGVALAFMILALLARLEKLLRQRHAPPSTPERPGDEDQSPL